MFHISPGGVAAIKANGKSTNELTIGLLGHSVGVLHLNQSRDTLWLGIIFAARLIGSATLFLRRGALFAVFEVNLGHLTLNFLGCGKVAGLALLVSCVWMEGESLCQNEFHKITNGN